MKIKLLIFILGIIITFQPSCTQNKQINHRFHLNDLQSNLIELNDVSKEIHEIVKINKNWSDTATILLVNELIIEITNLLLVNKLSNINPSVVKNKYKEVYSDSVKTRLKFIRETIKKNYRGIQMLSNTYPIRNNESVLNKIDKANEIIRSSIALLDKDIENLQKNKK